jgi:hypothetical protein
MTSLSQPTHQSQSPATYQPMHQSQSPAAYLPRHQGQRPATYQPRPKAWVTADSTDRALKARRITASSSLCRSLLHIRQSLWPRQALLLLLGTPRLQPWASSPAKKKGLQPLGYALLQTTTESESKSAPLHTSGALRGHSRTHPLDTAGKIARGGNKGFVLREQGAPAASTDAKVNRSASNSSVTSP